jgi:hypothetical protein
MQITGEDALNHLKELAAHDTFVRAVVRSGSECSVALVGKLTHSPGHGFCITNKEAEVNFSDDVLTCDSDLDLESIVHTGSWRGNRSSFCIYSSS